MIYQRIIEVESLSAIGKEDLVILFSTYEPRDEDEKLYLKSCVMTSNIADVDFKKTLLNLVDKMKCENVQEEIV